MSEDNSLAGQVSEISDLLLASHAKNTQTLLLDAIPFLFSTAFSLDVQLLKRAAAPSKALVVQRLQDLGPPSQFRLIDCRSTCAQQCVVLVDGHPRQDRYTAVSHTWGQEVYGVFDCQCSSKCSAPGARCSETPCPGIVMHGETHKQVVADILQMCERLLLAGSEFVWHDGVCIAQHDAEEVEETIKHMGWIYTHAADTVIFLDYIGNPMALLAPYGPVHRRWIKRVWTVQEAVLSRKRRYCVRLVPIFENDNAFSSGNKTLEDFEAKLYACYEDDSCIAVIEEEQLWTQLLSLCSEIQDLSRHMCTTLALADSHPDFNKMLGWILGLQYWVIFMQTFLFFFPTLAQVISLCACTRDSKHEGDRINSVLGLAGITDFVAPKDGDLEVSSIEFFKRVGQEGLREVVFSVNTEWAEDVDKKHTWIPCLSRYVSCANSRGISRMSSPMVPNPLTYVVLENGMLEMRGEEMWCVPIKFTFTKQNSELECLNLEEYWAACGGCNTLAVDLAGDYMDWQNGGGFHAFASASCSRLGQAVFPSCQKILQFKGRPVIQGQIMEVGSSFSAYLVLGEVSLVDESPEYCLPALIVLAKSTDDEALQAPVIKIGFFKADSRLVWLLFGGMLNVPVVTMDHLVID